MAPIGGLTVTSSAPQARIFVGSRRQQSPGERVDVAFKIRPVRRFSGTVVISETDFIGPANFVQATGSGTWTEADGSVIDLFYYNDPDNAQGALQCPEHPRESRLQWW